MPGLACRVFLGIILEVVTIVLTYVWHGGLAALGVTLIILAVVGIVISLALRSVTKGRRCRNRRSSSTMRKARRKAMATRDMEVFLGKEGVTTTVLRPTGMAEFEA